MIDAALRTARGTRNLLSEPATELLFPPRQQLLYAAPSPPTTATKPPSTRQS